MSYLRQLEVDDRPWPVIARLACAATTAETLYTATGGVNAIRVRVVNRSASSQTFRLAYRPLGVTLTTAHYLEYDAAIAANVSVTLDLFLQMVNTDVLPFYGSAAELTVTLFGGA